MLITVIYKINMVQQRKLKEQHIYLWVSFDLEHFHNYQNGDYGNEKTELNYIGSVQFGSLPSGPIHSK